MQGVIQGGGGGGGGGRGNTSPTPDIRPELINFALHKIKQYQK